VETKVSLNFVTIAGRLKQTPLPQVDWVVGIATGGVVPASLVAYQLERPLSLLTINYRAPDNTPRHREPVLLHSAEINPDARHILLVDDVSVTGQTLDLARRLLKDRQVTTLVLKGQADVVLFPEIAACINWPWKTENGQSV